MAYAEGDAAGEFIRALLGRNQIIFALIAHDEEEHRVKFTLRGADGPLRRALESCGQTAEQARVRREMEKAQAERRRAERKRKHEEKMRRMREETERLKRERGATYSSPEAEPEQTPRPQKYRPAANSSQAADRIGKVLDDTGAARPPARPSPRPAAEAPRAAPGDEPDNPVDSVLGFVGDAAGFLTEDIEIKEGGSGKLRP